MQYDQIDKLKSSGITWLQPEEMLRNTEDAEFLNDKHCFSSPYHGPRERELLESIVAQAQAIGIPARLGAIAEQAKFKHSTLYVCQSATLGQIEKLAQIITHERAKSKEIATSPSPF